jgi:hypothetical protein
LDTVGDPSEAVTQSNIVERRLVYLDHLNQIRRDLWRYTEIGSNGEALVKDTREMALRWTYRWELRHLLELCGLSVEAEYSDFAGSAPAYGKELICVAKVA